MWREEREGRGSNKCSCCSVELMLWLLSLISSNSSSSLLQLVCHLIVAQFVFLTLSASSSTHSCNRLEYLIRLNANCQYEYVHFNSQVPFVVLDGLILVNGQFNWEIGESKFAYLSILIQFDSHKNSHGTWALLHISGDLKHSAGFWEAIFERIAPNSFVELLKNHWIFEDL